MKTVAATIAITMMLSFSCSVQGLQTLVLQGKDSSWKQLGSVEANTSFQIRARGTADFGGIGNDDGVAAGVTGNAFVKWCTDKFSLPVCFGANTASGGTIYDNVPGAADDINKASPQAIAGGDIVIHSN
jgi:hypothetical protein